MDSLQCCFSVVFAWRWDEDNHAWFHVCMERRKYNIAFLSCRIPQTRIPKMLPMKVKNVGSKREKSAWTLFHVSNFHEKQTCIASILVLNLHIIYVYYRSCCCYFFEEERERFESDSRKVNFFSENRFPIPNNIHIFFSIFFYYRLYTATPHHCLSLFARSSTSCCWFKLSWALSRSYSLLLLSLLLQCLPRL